MRTSPLVAAFVFMTSGCGTDIGWLALSPIADQPIIAVYPPDGAMRLREDVDVRVVMGDERPPTVVVIRNGVREAVPCAFGPWPFVAECGVLHRVDAEDELALFVDAVGETRDVDWDADGPVPGLGWSLMDGVELTTLGGAAPAAAAVNPYLQSTDAFVALDGYDGTPGTWNLVAGQSGLQLDGQIAPTAAGFTFLVPVQIGEDGALEGSAPTAWLSVLMGDTQVDLLLLDVEVRGKVTGPLLQDLVVSAHLPALSLSQISDALGALGPLLMDLIQLDVDRDGDGTPESATVELRGSPAPAELSWWY